MNDTAINWTEKTWNPASGCTQVTEGCKFCYAQTLAERYRGTPAFPNGFDLTIRPHKLKEPYRLKEPSLIFVNSMSDLFWEAIPDDYRDQIVDVIEATPQHQYQVLTKRPENMLTYSKRRKLPANFWAGTTIESPRTAHRMDTLRQIDAEIKFLSIEPLLGFWQRPDFTGIQWVITGGESGTHLQDAKTCERRGLVMKVFGKWTAVPEKQDWIREIRDACLQSGTAFWHKQWGGPVPHSAGRELDGRTWDELPKYAQVQAPSMKGVPAKSPERTAQVPSRSKPGQAVQMQLL